MSPTNAPQIAIVGAGLAGLAAAAHLLQRYSIRATVFESQRRVGGRVQSISVESSPQREPLVLDLGATWFHGTHGNVAYDVAVRSGAVPDSRRTDGGDEQWDEDCGVLLFSAPAVVVTEGIAGPASSESVLTVVRAYATALRKMENGDQRRGGKQCDDESVMQFVRRLTRFDHMAHFDKAVFQARDAFEACVNGCDSSTSDLSMIGVSDYVTLKGDNVRPHGGMNALVDAFVNMLDESQIELNRKVVRVAYGVEKGDSNCGTVRIAFEDGHAWQGDCVIWTPSINVTRAAVHDRVFEPCLPEEKIAALEDRVLGIVEKVFVLLKTPLENVLSDSSMPVLWEDFEAVQNPQPWWSNVYSVLYSSEHCMVSFWLTGDAAKRVCSLSNEQRSKQIESLLTILYSQSVMIEKVVCSQWSMSESTLGSYSYPKVGSSHDAVRALAEPISSMDRPVLCFAGEATHQHFFSTMHGAVESGYREADRIAALLKPRPEGVS